MKNTCRQFYKSFNNKEKTLKNVEQMLQRNELEHSSTTVCASVTAALGKPGGARGGEDGAGRSGIPSLP